MKINLLPIIILLAIFLIPTKGFTQTTSISGSVFTFDSIPLINANIEVKSSKQEVKTDLNGRFSLECKTSDVLTVSANGFSSEKVKLDGNSSELKINLKLKSGDKNITIAIDNGHIQNIENFKALASISVEEKDYSQYANIYEIIQEKIPGAQINNGEIIIRGMNRMQVEANVDNGALIVVDGVINDKSILSTLPTSLVKNVKLLKDSNTAMYGSRGANGVISIETKRVDNN